MVLAVIIEPQRSRWLVGEKASVADECAALAMLHRKIVFALKLSVSVHWGLRAKHVGRAVAVGGRVGCLCSVPVCVASALERIGSNRGINE